MPYDCTGYFEARLIAFFVALPYLPRGLNESRKRIMKTSFCRQNQDPFSFCSLF